ncbi:MAG: ATP-binding protein, partial [Lachnospiraceae bacterium]|nr:ATP-binding protein [Lachnospiraceae bacterium]
LVAAVNPCPCGNYPDMNSCSCTPEQIRRYLSKLSGPILDRIDICIETPKITLNDLSGGKKGMSSGYMREKVMKACEIQKERYKGKGIEFNSQLSPKDMDEFILLGKAERRLVEEVYEKMNLSARGYHRILKVARTIADIDGDKDIKKKHIMEAVCYRGIEDKYWGNGI